ncbi:MAG: alpha/beta fold hydrolase [Paracoccaceae bacterium]
MTPLILLPGMMCDARLFAPQIAALSDQCAVSTPDIGRHETVEAIAAEVLKNAPPQFALGGLSMGGIVAMEVVRQAPERLLGLALMDTNPLAEKDEVKARRAVQIADVRAGNLRRVMQEDMKPNYLFDGPKQSAVLDLCMSMALDLGPEVFVRQSIALRDRPDQTETLRGYHGPTLILCGRDDRLCPVERHELMLGLIQNATLQIVEQAGHLPTLERPEETTAALQRWLAGV